MLASQLDVQVLAVVSPPNWQKMLLPAPKIGSLLAFSTCGFLKSNASTTVEAILSKSESGSVVLVKLKYMEELFHDSLGFVTAKMIRRIVGVAHIEDFESIKEASKRAKCEHRALNFATILLKDKRRFNSISEVVSVIELQDDA